MGGFLTGQIKSLEDLPADDFRRSDPRFMGDAFEKNLALVREVGTLAAQNGCTPAQIALAWVMAVGNDVVPVPGTKRRTYLEDNVGSLNITLTTEDRRRIEAAMAAGVVTGQRYADMGSIIADR